MTPVRFGRPLPATDPGVVVAPGSHPPGSDASRPPAPSTNPPGSNLPARGRGSGAGERGSSLAFRAGGGTHTLRQQRVGEAVDLWCGRLLELGGESALADISQLGAAAVDLTAAHPSGIAQLFAGRPTMLSNLVREQGALSTARRRARTVLARADELAQRYGVAPTYLAIGIASWSSLVPASTESADGQDGGPGLGPDSGPAGPGVADHEGAGDEAAGAEPDAPVSGSYPGLPVALPDDPDAGDGLVRRTVRAPMLLRPVLLGTRSETDVDLRLEPSVEVNPVLVRALRAAGSTLDVVALARRTITEHGFVPGAALERLRAEGEAALPGFRFAEHLVLGPFVHPGQVLVEDLDGRRRELAAHDVVAALAGDPDAGAAVRTPLPPVVAGDRPPGAERGVGDLDPSQQQVVDAVAAGSHLFVDAPPGADVATTLAAVVADAAASGRHVLYVSGTRRAGQGLREAMASAGLDGLMLDLSSDSRWHPGAGARLAAGAGLGAPTVDDARAERIRGELSQARARLSAYISALHAPRPAWGVCAYDALQALAALTSPQVRARTKVRLDAATVRALAGDERRAAAEALRRAAELGAFSLTAADTPWYGAALTDPGTAQWAVDLVRRLGQESLPGVERRIAAICGETGLARPDRLRSWADQLAMLESVQATLDLFRPEVFESPLEDYVAATGDRRWRAASGVELSWSARHRLERAARDLVRPGRGVADLHGALVEVLAQRDAWRSATGGDGPPVVPDSLWDASEDLRAVLADVAAIEPVLAGTPESGDLAGMRLDDLAARLSRLADDVAALGQLPERTRLLDSLSGLGLGDLVADLAARRVPPDMVESELELAWWSSVFEEILRADPAVGGYDGGSLGELAERYRTLDTAHVATLPGPVLRAVARRRREALGAAPGRLHDVLADLAAERVSDVRAAVAELGALAGTLRPCWLVAPMQVPQLLDAGRTVDLVVLDAAQHLPVEQAVSAISRGAQVVVVGDSRRSALDAEGAPQRVVQALAELLPRVTLNADRVVREPALMAFLGEHGYADVIRSVPTPQTRSALRLEVVDGFGMPSAGSGVVESVQKEVDRVVDLVIEHALTRPEESLVVLTVGLRHADRVREAVRAAVADSPALREFFAPGRQEPFAVLELDSAAGVRRDAVLLSLGLGKTPHGRVMHRFGRVSDPDGAGLLIDAIDACRRRLTVVSCFAPEELDRWRLRTPGPLLLADLLEAAAAGTAPASTTPDEGEPDQLLVDLADRLSQMGLTVGTRYGVPGGKRIPLVLGHPAQPDELLLAVLTDDAEYAAQPSLRIRDRHDVQRLTDRGWGVHMAFSTAVFLDPQAEAENVVAALRRLLAARRAQHLELRPAPARRRPAAAEPAPPAAPTLPPAEEHRSAVAEEQPPARTDVPAQPHPDVPAGPHADALAEPHAHVPAGPHADMPAEPRADAVSEPGPAPVAVAAEKTAVEEDVAAVEPTAPAAGEKVGEPLGAGAGAAAPEAPVGSGASPARSAAGRSTVESELSDVAAGLADVDATILQMEAEFADHEPVAGEGPDGREPVSVSGGDGPLEAAGRPDVQRGMPVSAYSAEDLLSLARWIASQEGPRDIEAIERRLRAELGAAEPGERAWLDAAVAAAVLRAIG